MSVAMFDSSAIPVLEQVVGFTQARHNVLAGNIANLDTPGYRVRDLPPEVFQERLKEAIEARNTRDTAVPSSHTRGEREAAMANVSESIKSILYHDQSDVGLEQQVAEVTKNKMQHDMAIAILTSQFKLLQAAVSERA